MPASCGLICPDRPSISSRVCYFPEEKTIPIRITRLMRPKRLIFTIALTPAISMALPEGFVIREFGGPPQLEYPTAISAAANGDVYVSSDKNGSLGHVDAYGKIVRARDTNNDGKAD